MNGSLTHLSLFSGIGGIDLAAEWAGFRTIGQVEQNKYANRVLRTRFGRKIPRWTDIRDLSADDFKRRTGIDSPTLISGGFPCQPFSCAGKRRGKEDDRHLWPEMFRVVRELRPTWVFGENVAGFINMELEACCSDLEDEGYTVRAFLVPACGVGALHRRERVFIIANSLGAGTRMDQQDPLRQKRESPGTLESEMVRRGNGAINAEGVVPSCEIVAYSEGGRCDRRERGSLPAAGSSIRCEDVAHTNGTRTGEQTRNLQPKEHSERKERGIGLRSVFITSGEDVSYPQFASQGPQCWERSGRNLDSQYADRDSVGDEPRNFCASQPLPEDVAYSQSKRLEGDVSKILARSGEGRGGSHTNSTRSGWWDVEPAVGRVAHGVPHRVDRLRCLGNAVVPQQAYPILAGIAQIQNGEKV